jgi:hypothetical protein
MGRHEAQAESTPLTGARAAAVPLCATHSPEADRAGRRPCAARPPGLLRRPVAEPRTFSRVFCRRANGAITMLLSTPSPWRPGSSRDTSLTLRQPARSSTSSWRNKRAQRHGGGPGWQTPRLSWAQSSHHAPNRLGALTVGGSREACGTVKMRIGTEKECAGAYE